MTEKALLSGRNGLVDRRRPLAQPGRTQPDSRTSLVPLAQRHGWLAFTALGALLSFFAAVRPLSVPDEGRYAEISRWMLVSGDWLVPRLNGLPFFHKPPLTHWEQAASMVLFGVSPWAARVPEILLALLMVYGLYTLVCRYAGATLAARSALMLATGAGILAGGQFVNHDIGVAAWIASAIACFAISFRDGQRPHAGWARAGFVACALGVMTKGLIGVVLPGLVLCLWITWTRQWRKAWRLPWGSGSALFALIAVPWFVVVGSRFPDFWDYLFGVQQFSRYLGTGFNNVEHWWFYLAVLPLLLVPWSLFAVAGAWRPKRRLPAREPAGQGGLVSLCWIWMGVTILFFSIPSSKLVGYILPALPPLALLSAVGWQHTLERWRHAHQAWAGLAVVAIALSATFTFAASGAQRLKLSGDVALQLAQHILPGDTVLVTGRFPYDLPFVAQLDHPLVVVEPWSTIEKTEDDSWRREIFEAARFDPELGAQLLQPPSFLPLAARERGFWLVVPNSADLAAIERDWRLVYRGRGWTLLRSKG
jgi:4-amino-4-deoxy-L-arabinose transferase-like glycosyltransferase